MEETIIFPSPNWFQTSGLAVSCDGWLIYGGPSKSLCALEPLPAERDGVLLGKHNFTAHVVMRAHVDKITCVAISPEWPEKRDILAGSADGMVKQWSLEQIDQKWRLKTTQSHEKHHHDKEEVVGVAYSHDSYAITVGCFGNIWKWDIKSNVVKYFKNLKAFKPTCVACSPHIPLHVAIGTKQGVVFVLDLTGAGKTLYKVRGQDDEITNVSWCPQFEVLVKKALGEPDKRPAKTEKISVATQKVMQIRQLTDEEKQQLSDGENMETKEEKGEETEGQEVIVENEKIEKEVNVISDTLDEVKPSEKKDKVNVLEDSGIVKSLPEDSFDMTIEPEDDMFDIYKDHEADEFGHKKYQPEEILVKVKEETEPADYLTECLKLKEEILKRKHQQEDTMESLVKAMDDAHLDRSNEMPSTSDTQASKDEVPSTEDNLESNAQSTKHQAEKVDSSVHVHKHLLASIGKYGSIRVWSKSGKLVGSCVVASSGNKNQRTKSPSWSTMLWYKSDVLLIADGKSQLLECNPLQIDCKNKLVYQLVHQAHRRGLFCIATDAPRVQAPDQSYDQYSVWTAAQDRNIVCYSLATRQKIAVLATCGGFVYDIKACPYDAGKVAVSVSDGAVRVWETETSEDDLKLCQGNVHMHWQHVQGKVLTVAWHPTKENLLAFSTGESRVGLIDTHSKSERSARNLLSALSGGVYSLCWGAGSELYACGGGGLVLYHTHSIDEAPTPVPVEWEGQKWELSAVVWRPNAMLVGSLTGAVALLTPEYPHTVVAATFVFSKMIHTIDWHPQETSSSSEVSLLKNLIAVCSLDKSNSIVILDYVENKDGVKQLNTWKTLRGHKGTVLQLCWSPHDDELLLSTSQDCTVRVWDVVSGVCTHVFGGHAACSLSAAFSPYPQLRRAVLSGGSDACLRLWRLQDHPVAAYTEFTPETHKKKKHSHNKKTAKTEEAAEQGDNTVATAQESTFKSDKKFLLPVLTKQLSACSIQGVRKMLKKYLEKNGGAHDVVEEDMEQSYNVNYIKIFGSIKEVNEVLDEELERHEDTGNVEPWIMLSVFRGHIDTMLQFASARDLLCPYLLSMAPCVSLKYWKDASQLYLAQIDRMLAKGEEHKLCENKSYGGAVYRKAATLLSVHDVKGAVDALADGRLYKEAYILCRTRYMDSIAEQTLQRWVEDCLKSGNFKLAAVCQVALGNLSEAANILSKAKDESWLSLAAELAKVVGQNTFADHISEKRKQIKNSATSESVEEELEKLPSRIELLLKENETKDAIMKESTSRDLTSIIKDEDGQGDVKAQDLTSNKKDDGQGDVKAQDLTSIIKDEDGQGDVIAEMSDGKKDINKNEVGQGDMEYDASKGEGEDHDKNSNRESDVLKENGDNEKEVLNGQ